MFTKGRILFVLIFVAAFVVSLVIGYRRDIAKDKGYYRRSLWVLMGFAAFFALVWLLKSLFAAMK